MNKPELFFILFIILFFTALGYAISWGEIAVCHCKQKGGVYVHGQCFKAEVIK